MPTTSNIVSLEARLKRQIRDIPDFPQPGIMFRDITPLLSNASLFHESVDAMIEPFSDIDHVIIIESRGFIFGTPIAYAIGAGIVPVRKPGKLPAATFSEEYALEYGSNILEIHQDALKPGERVLIVDDLLATGGTVRATINLVNRIGAEIAGISVLAELAALNGRAVLGDYQFNCLVTY
ncbi:MAG: adenine phosphoribosyltransferase [Thermomicrobiales bacterium]